MRKRSNVKRPMAITLTMLLALTLLLSGSKPALAFTPLWSPLDGPHHQEEMKAYSHPDWGLSFLYPAPWTIQEETEIVWALDFRELNVGDIAMFGLMAGPSVSGKSLLDVLHSFELEEVKAEPSMPWPIAGQTGEGALFQALEPHSKIAMTGYIALFSRDDMPFALMAMATSDTWAERGPVLETIIYSLSFEGAVAPPSPTPTEKPIVTATFTPIPTDTPIVTATFTPIPTDTPTVTPFPTPATPVTEEPTPEAVLSAEAEPNDRFSKANPIASSGAVSGAIDPLGDHDWYRLSVPSAGELHILVTNVAPEMEVVMQIWSANHDVLLGWQDQGVLGADTDITFDLPSDGTYYLEVAESWNDAASAQPYNMETTFTPATDPGEPNNRFADATSLTPGLAIQATIFPKGDHDWYSFQVPGRSQVRVFITEVPQDMEAVFQVWNANKDLILGWQEPPSPGADTDITFDLPSDGTYYLEVAESFNDSYSTQPYTLVVTVIPAVDAGEDNDSFMNAHPLQLDQEVQGAILPRGDHDWYKLEIPAAGVLNVSITDNPPELDMECQVWNGDKGVVCAWQSAPGPGDDAQITCSIEEPGLYYLEVGDRHNDASSPEAYHLVATVRSP